MLPNMFGLLLRTPYQSQTFLASPISETIPPPTSPTSIRCVSDPADRCSNQPSVYTASGLFIVCCPCPLMYCDPCMVLSLHYIPNLILHHRSCLCRNQIQIQTEIQIQNRIHAHARLKSQHVALGYIAICLCIGLCNQRKKIYACGLQLSLLY